MSILQEYKIVQLFTIKANDGTIFRFTTYPNEKKEPWIMFNGDQYIAVGVQFDQGSVSTQTFEHPKLTIANFANEEKNLSQILRQYDDFLGCPFLMRIIEQKYLDKSNFLEENQDSVQPDKSQGIVRKYMIDRKSSENIMAIEFELKPALADLKNPFGVRIATDTCQHVYRGPLCGYTGPAVADIYGNPTTDLTKDMCSKRLIDGCTRYRYKDGITPAWMFPGASNARELS